MWRLKFGINAPSMAGTSDSGRPRALETVALTHCGACGDGSPLLNARQLLPPDALAARFFFGDDRAARDQTASNGANAKTVKSYESGERRCAPARACAPSGSPPRWTRATGGRRSERGAAGGLLEPVADRAPGAHVLRLLLRPDDLLERRVRRDELARRRDRERVELLEPRDRDLGASCAPRGRRCRSTPCPCRARAGARPLVGAAVVEHRPERPVERSARWTRPP